MNEVRANMGISHKSIVEQTHTHTNIHYLKKLQYPNDHKFSLIKLKTLFPNITRLSVSYLIVFKSNNLLSLFK